MIKLRDDVPEFISEDFSIVSDGLIVIPYSFVKRIRDLISDIKLVALGHLQALAMDCQEPQPIIRIQIGEQAPITLTPPKVFIDSHFREFSLFGWIDSF